MNQREEGEAMSGLPWLEADSQMMALVRPRLTEQVGPPRPDTLTVLPLLAAGEGEVVRRANRMICQVQPYPADSKSGSVYGYWDLFELLHAYMLYRAELDAGAVDRIQQVFQAELQPDGRVLKTDFTYGNVNHPLTTTALSIVGGEQFGIPRASDAGVQKLDHFARIWAETGSFSEYNSPTYQAVNFVALATIAMFSRQREVAVRARVLQERLWLETVARFHGPTWTLAGPHARAYSWDTLGGSSDTQYAIRRVLGPNVPLWLDIMEKYTEPSYRYHWFGRAAALTYGLPGYLRDLALGKPLPIQVKATTRSASHLLGERRDSLTTYLASDFSLGSATGPYANGVHKENPIAFWKKRSPVRRHEDIRSLFVRYLSGDKGFDEEGQFLPSEGDNYVFQHENRAVVIAMPRPLSKEAGVTASSLHLDVFISLFGRLDEVWVGHRSVDGLPVEFGRDDVVLVRDGRVYVALKPLAFTDLGSPARMRIAHNGPNLVFSLCNYRGASRAFSSDVLESVYNGFCIEISDASRCPSFEAFRRAAEAWRIDTVVGAAGIEAVAWEGGSTGGDAAPRLSLRFDPEARSISERKIGDTAVSEPMFECPFAAMGQSGELALQEVRLETAPGVTTYLFVNPERRTYVAVNPTPEETPFWLVTPEGEVRVDRLAFGKVVFAAECGLGIEAVSLKGEVSWEPRGRLPEVSINGKQLSADLRTWDCGAG